MSSFYSYVKHGARYYHKRCKLCFNIAKGYSARDKKFKEVIKNVKEGTWLKRLIS